MNRNIIIHVHIFKNAGSTFDWSLNRNFEYKFIDHRDNIPMIKDKISYLINYLEKNPHIKALSSHHIHFEIKTIKNYQFHKVYFLRDPILRAKSVYTFEKKQSNSDTPGSKKAKQLSFKDFISWYLEDDSPRTIQNSQTAFCAGLDIDAIPELSTLKKAIFNIGQNPLIGVVERYDESMVIFEDVLTPFFPEIDLSYVIQNKTSNHVNFDSNNKIKITNELEDIHDHLLKKNNLDLEIYRFANSIIDKRIQSIKNFSVKLEKFRDRCIQLSNKIT